MRIDKLCGNSVTITSGNDYLITCPCYRVNSDPTISNINKLFGTFCRSKSVCNLRVTMTEFLKNQTLIRLHISSLNA